MSAKTYYVVFDSFQAMSTYESDPQRVDSGSHTQKDPVNAPPNNSVVESDPLKVRSLSALIYPFLASPKTDTAFVNRVEPSQQPRIGRRSWSSKD